MFVCRYNHDIKTKAPKVIWNKIGSKWGFLLYPIIFKRNNIEFVQLVLTPFFLDGHERGYFCHRKGLWQGAFFVWKWQILFHD